MEVLMLLSHVPTVLSQDFRGAEAGQVREILAVIPNHHLASLQFMPSCLSFHSLQFFHFLLPCPQGGTQRILQMGHLKGIKLYTFQRIHIEFYTIVCFPKVPRKWSKSILHTHYFQVLKIKASLQPQMPPQLLLLKIIIKIKQTKQKNPAISQEMEESSFLSSLCNWKQANLPLSLPNNLLCQEVSCLIILRSSCNRRGRTTFRRKKISAREE